MGSGSPSVRAMTARRGSSSATWHRARKYGSRKAITRDDMESRYTRDVLPGYAFTPDSKSIVITIGGKFAKVNVPSGTQSNIPFSADVDVPMGPLVRFEYPINDSTIQVRQIRGAAPSPDGKRLAFTALDRLWLVDLAGCPAAGCTPKRVTAANVGEHSPVWSPDGAYLAWVTWTEAGGDVMRIGTKAGAKPERLTKQTAFYEDLNYDPTGRRLVVVRGPRQQRVERENEFEGPGPQVMELVWLPANGGDATMIAPVNQYGRPHFTRDTTRVFFYDAEDALVSVRWDGTDRKAHLKVTGYKSPRLPDDGDPDSPDEMLISPDGSRAFVSIDNKLYLVDVPVTGGKTPTVSIEDAGGRGASRQDLARRRRLPRLESRRQEHPLVARPLVLHVRHRRGREGGEGFHGEGGQSLEGRGEAGHVSEAGARVLGGASRRGDHRAKGPADGVGAAASAPRSSR